MNCNLENLQAYMDHELDEFSRREMEKHFNSCRSCRRELARLQLIWLELAETETVAPPPELPYLRQQVITSIVSGRLGEPKEGAGIWNTLEMAWQPFLIGASFLPGAGLISRLNQTVNPKMGKPGVISFSKNLWQFARRNLTRGDRP